MAEGIKTIKHILLVKPFNKYRFTQVPPIGLGYLAKALKQNNLKVSIIDATKNCIHNLIPIIQNIGADAVGINFMTCDYDEVIHLTNSIKEYNSSIVTIVGGPHVSALPKKTLYNIPTIDFGIVGEGEPGLPMLLKGTELDHVPGLVWRNEDIINTNVSELVQDIDMLGSPDWSLIDPRNYSANPVGGSSRAAPFAYIITSRGCPFPCTFCAGKLIYGTKVRYRSIPNVMEEIEDLVKNYGVKEIHILDDNFAFRKDHVISFCQEILSRNLKLHFICSNGIRLESLDLELCQMMKQAGFYAISIGIESGSNKILKDIKKKITTDMIFEKVSIIRKAGLDVMGLFMLGYPTETVNDIEETIAFAKRLPINRAAFTNFLPLPGSAIYSELTAKGDIADEDWKNFSYYTVSKSYSPHLTREDLEKLLRKSMREFYLRPKQIYYFLRNINSFKHLLELIKRIIGQFL